MITKVVHKYNVPSNGPAKITMPMDAKIVLVGMQNDAVCIWAEHTVEVDKQPVTHERTFDIYGTGWAIPLTAQHLGSIIDAPYVWHVYEVFA